MVNIRINNTPLQVAERTSIMAAAAQAGYKIPKLCFLKEINEIGACRVCLVEIEGKKNLVASCNNVVEEGMSILTDSPKVQAARKANVEFILSQHDYRCATCVRNKNCSLQDLAGDLNILDIPFLSEIERLEWDNTFPLIRDSGKCIKCMRCVQVCDKVQGMSVWDITNTGKRTSVSTRDGEPIRLTDCAVCGQCITHCPTGALRERDDTSKVMGTILNEDKIVIAQIAPAVRAAWGEGFGLSRKEATVGRMVAAAKELGFDYVFDTDFSADLTIMEEATEFLGRLTDIKETKKPMFTSCCPGWVRFMKIRYPQYADRLSSAKSPQQMFGAVAKSYYADILGVEPDKIYCVSVMPCTAKKYECDVPQVNDTGADRDVDVVLTTREFVRMLRAAQVNVTALEEESFDEPLGIGTGAGVIFGVTGGVMEAALRSAYYFVTGENPKPDAFSIVRGQEGIREAVVAINGVEYRAAVVSGLGNAAKLMERIDRGEVTYDFVEVMACPGGCSGGGGQPILDGVELADVRGEHLYHLDRNCALRFSHENPAITAVYRSYFGEPMSEKAHRLLHTDQREWDL